LKWFFGFFLVSGFCSLVYEIVWLRLAMASFGVTTAMISTVLSVFMAGLGLGSWCGGIFIKRFTGNDTGTGLRLYALAELLIGISAVSVPYQLKVGQAFLQGAITTAAWGSSRYYLLAGVWVALTLLPWCACMGATFPLLMSVIERMGVTEFRRSFSYLYVANLLGALLGTIVSVLFLIELFGFRGTLHVAGTLNAVLALSAFFISSALIPSSPVPSRGAQELAPQMLRGFPEKAIPFILFTTGFASMGMEVIWIRQFSPYLGNVVYAFAGILAVYLFATFWGSQDYRSWIRSHRPDESTFSWALLAFASVLPLAAADPLWPIRIGNAELGGVRLSSIVLFCALTGFLTPLLLDSWSSGDPEKAGRAYAANILGCLLGPLVAGFWLLPWLGERWSLLVLATPLFGFGIVSAAVDLSRRSIGADARFMRWLKYGGVALASALVIIKTHDYEKKYSGAWVRRDASATVIAQGEGWGRDLLVNGIGMTRLNPITKYIAHLPLAFMTRPPRNGLVVCFGMGTTYRSMLSWGIPTTAVDLVPSVPKMFGYYFLDAPKVLSSPLGRIVLDDGRRYLDGSSETYDVIVVDPPPPPAAPGSSLLYSREFYEVAKKHLPPDGILQTWYPERDGDVATRSSIAKTLKQSFPYVRAFQSFDRGYGIHFLASMRPLPTVSAATLAARMPAAAVTDLIEWGPEFNVDRQLHNVLSQERSIDQMIAQNPRVPALEDDQPINEYYALRIWFNHYR
jgi:spermidine synthase